jgi:hypothetical protein
VSGWIQETRGREESRAVQVRARATSGLATMARKGHSPLQNHALQAQPPFPKHKTGKVCAIHA